MKTLIVYGTYSGSTEYVAQVIETQLRAENRDVTVQNVRKTHESDFRTYDTVILGSNSWWELKEEGQMNGGFHTLLTQLQPSTFAHKKCFVYALGDSHQYSATFCKAADHLTQLITTHGGTITAEPLRIDRFYFNKDERIKEVQDWVKKNLA